MNWLKANKLSVKNPLQSGSFDLSLGSSVERKYKSKMNSNLGTPEKVKSNPSISLEKVNSKTLESKQSSNNSLIKKKQQIKLPLLKRHSVLNPQKQPQKKPAEQVFYQSQLLKALQSFDNGYMESLARQHFQQTVESLRLTKNVKIAVPKKEIKLEKKTKHKKTIYLDLDETLIHTDQTSNNYSIKLRFPIDNGDSIQAGVRIRPYCRDFLTQLAKFAEIIIFTASSASYADVILDHLDPEKKIFAHRLYRNHCTLEKGFFIKDLRCINRELQNVAIVDNSAISFLLQPQNGIPILPFFYYKKDLELKKLLPFLKQLSKADDCRAFIEKKFFWSAYRKQKGDIKKIFIKKMNKEEKQINSD